MRHGSWFYGVMHNMKKLSVISFVAVAGAAFGEFKKQPEPKDVPELMVSSSGEHDIIRGVIAFAP